MKKRHNKSPFDKIADFFLNLKNEFLMLSTAQKVIVSAVSGILLVAIIGGIVVIAVFSGDSDPADSDTSAVVDSSSSVSSQSYDPTEFEIEPENPNILAETPEADEEYLLNSMFLGDSNTIGFASNGYLPLENVAGIEGIGIQSVASHRGIYYQGSDTAQTIPYAVAAQQPQRVFMTFGTNNLVNVSTEQFITQYKLAIAAILEAYEYTDIIVVTIPPIAEVTTSPNVSQKVIDQFNLALVEMVEENGWKLLNTTTLLKDSDGYIKPQYIASDGYHLSSAAHEAIINFANTHVLDTEDRRPKPLEAQPTRKDPPAPVEDSSSSSSSVAGIATEGEIEKLKLAVTNGKKKLTESAVSTTGDGTDLSAADVARSWVPKTIYDSLNAAVVAGEDLLSTQNPLATAVITSEATINSQITIFEQSKKTEVDISEIQMAKNTLTALVAEANTTLKSATETTKTAAETEQDGVSYINTAFHDALEKAIVKANAALSNATPTITELNTATTDLTNANGSFITNIFTGTKPVSTTPSADQLQNLNNAISSATSALGTATPFPAGTDASNTAGLAAGVYVPQGLVDALNTAIATGNSAIATNTADAVTSATSNLNTHISNFNNGKVTVTASSSSSSESGDSSSSVSE